MKAASCLSLQVLLLLIVVDVPNWYFETFIGLHSGVLEKGVCFLLQEGGGDGPKILRTSGPYLLPTVHLMHLAKERNF
jgi:hypothetical protein